MKISWREIHLAWFFPVDLKAFKGLSTYGLCLGLQTWSENWGENLFPLEFFCQMFILLFCFHHSLAPHGSPTQRC